MMIGMKTSGRRGGEGGGGGGGIEKLPSTEKTKEGCIGVMVLGCVLIAEMDGVEYGNRLFYISYSHVCYYRLLFSWTISRSVPVLSLCLYPPKPPTDSY